MEKSDALWGKKFYNANIKITHTHTASKDDNLLTAFR